MIEIVQETHLALCWPVEELQATWQWTLESGRYLNLNQEDLQVTFSLWASILYIYLQYFKPEFPTASRPEILQEIRAPRQHCALIAMLPVTALFFSFIRYTLHQPSLSLSLPVCLPVLPLCTHISSWTFLSSYNGRKNGCPYLDMCVCVCVRSHSLILFLLLFNKYSVPNKAAHVFVPPCPCFHSALSRWPSVNAAGHIFILNSFSFQPPRHKRNKIWVIYCNIKHGVPDRWNHGGWTVLNFSTWCSIQPFVSVFLRGPALLHVAFKHTGQ